MTKLNLLPIAGIAVAGVLAAGAGTPTATPAAAHNSGNSSEMVDALPVTKDTEPIAQRVVYCIDLGSAPSAGEILHVDADLEVTNDLGYNVMLATHLLLTDSCSSTSGTEISEASAFNVTPDMHHGVPSRSGVLVAAGSSRRYVVLLAWSAASKAQPGDTVKVEADFGRLSVLRWA